MVAIPDRTHRRGQRLGSWLRDLAEAGILAAGIFLALQWSLQNTVVEGSSMQPNFVDRQWLLVSRLAYRMGDPGRGDVIVFKAPDRSDTDFIKRVIGLPGETVSLRKGRVYVDGKLMSEPWGPRFDDSDFPPFVVPAGQYFVLGDNRAVSNDSRLWEGSGAALPREEIIGRAWLCIWPRASWGPVQANWPTRSALAGR